ncbi:hypothetical protein F5Y04DRAFT_289242 [Hypomontagnella monticulosa]|nr:hypothetical protein F5Y04DRAFT_289242 [Hypomontagnella monticulosa]
MAGGLDGIRENPIVNTQDDEANDTAIKRIMEIKSFLEQLGASSSGSPDETKDLDVMLASLGENQINIHTDDYSKETILHTAVRRGLEYATRVLLDSGASVSERDYCERQPLHIAASYGYIGIVNLFLEEDASRRINAPGKWEMTALHCAAYEGHEEIIEVLLDAGAEVDVKDMDGWTPLMAATKDRHLNSMSMLLDKKGYDQANIRDNTDKTPFLVAIEDDNLEGVFLLLERMPVGSKRDSSVYQRLLLYDMLTPDKGVPHYQLRMLIRESIFDTLRNHQRTFEEALLWAAAKFERHKIARELLLLNSEPESNERQPSQGFTVIELATQRKKPEILWLLIATSPRTPEVIRSIGSARALLSPETGHQQTANVGIRRRGGKYGDKNRYNDDSYGNVASTDGDQSRVMRRMLDILDDPQIAQVYEDSAILQPPRLKPEYSGLLTRFEARIARFYKAKHVSVTVRRTRNLNDTIYDEGPTGIMSTAVSDLKNTMKKSFETKDGNPKSTRLRDMYDDNNLKFTHVHLPATNIEWMKDLLLRIIVDERMGDGAASYHEVSSFLQSTWFEIPDRTSKSRFMRPKFAERTQFISSSKRRDGGLLTKRSEEKSGMVVNDLQPEEAEGKESRQDHFIPSSALYMPFLSFATQTDDPDGASGKLGQNSRELMEAYEGLVVHSSATLDEAYYHFEPEDEQAQQDRKRRNSSQVVTKQLRNNDQGRSWPLLRVNQMWIWTIGNKWVISAVSHPVDDIEQPWHEGFTNHSIEQIEAGGSRYQPESTRDMMKMIVDYCIGSYERGRSYQEPGHQGLGTSLSIRQLFSNHINSIGRNESNLFEKVRNLDKENTPGREIKFVEATTEAETLFSEIKSVRDELNIIRSIGSYQAIVQRKLFGGDPKDSGLAASYVVNDITEMERRATRIQSAVNSTLSLLQSKIANFQAERSVERRRESAEQGKDLKVVAFVTFLFLPLLLFSSLLSTDLEAFEKAPRWVYGIVRKSF